MTYEVFKRTGVRVEVPALSITADGRVVINAAATRLLIEAGVKSVLLLWDKTNRRMAVKATRKGDKNAYAVSVSPGKHSGSLRAKAFVAHIGWRAPRREMLLATWNAEEKMLELTLPEKHLRSD